MTSDVAWQFPGASPKENIRLWYDDSGLTAYLWFQPPGGIKLAIVSTSTEPMSFKLLIPNPRC